MVVIRIQENRYSFVLPAVRQIGMIFLESNLCVKTAFKSLAQEFYFSELTLRK